MTDYYSGSEAGSFVDATSLACAALANPQRRSDFILIAEFCEIAGPKPICTIPPLLPFEFDLDDFALRIMAVDYQTQISGGAGFRVIEDTQVVLVEPQHHAHAFVQHLTLYDIAARGFVRPFCVGYITSSPDKVMKYFSSLADGLTKVCKYLEFGNRTRFLTALHQRNADLLYTRELLEALNEVDDGEPTRQDEIPTSEKIARIDKMQEDTEAIIHEVEPQVEDQKISRKLLREREKRAPVKFGADSPLVPRRRRARSLFSGAPEDGVMTRDRAGSLNVSTVEEQVDDYQPSFMNITQNRDFDAPLKTLPQLCGELHDVAMNKLQKTLRRFQRDDVVLTLESKEVPLLQYPATLLTMGRCVVLNFYQPQDKKPNLLHSDFVPTPLRPKAVRHLLGPADSLVDSSRNTGDADYDSDDSSAEWFDTDHQRCASPSQSFLIDASEDFHSIHGSREHLNDLTGFHAFGGETPIDASTPVRPGRRDNISLSSVTVDSMGSHFNDTGVRLDGDNPRQYKFPFQSSADHVCHISGSKPGANVLSVIRHYSFAKHLIFSLLIGRPVVIIGCEENENRVRALVTALWVFVAGHSRSYQVISWRNKSLRLSDLSGIKLIGLCKRPRLFSPESMTRYVTVLDFEKQTLNAPKYKGTLLEQLVLHHWFDNEVYLAHVHSFFLELASKSFLLYHSFSLDLHANPDRHQSFEALQDARDGFLRQIDVTGSDADVVSYLAEVVQLQQAADFTRLTGYPDGTSNSHVAPVRLDHQSCVLMANRQKGSSLWMPTGPVSRSRSVSRVSRLRDEP